MMVEEMGLPDRLNLNAKIGNFVDVFSDYEDYFINKQTRQKHHSSRSFVELFDLMKKRSRTTSSNGELDEDWKVAMTLDWVSTQGIFEKTESDEELSSEDSEDTKVQSEPTI